MITPDANITLLKELPPPPPEAAAHSARLVDVIKSAIDTAPQRLLPFEQFMELALYAPGLGYYSAGAQKFGAGGDFITAPDISPLFARCLARQCQQVLAECGDDSEIIELGAGSGVLAADLLAELALLGCVPTRYRILELSAELRQRQRATLTQRQPALAERVEWLDALPPEHSVTGLIIGNEVLDALPVQRFRITAQGPAVLGVTYDGASAELKLAAEATSDPAIAGWCRVLQQRLGEALPVGYESERCPMLEPWLASLAERLKRGVIVFIDYGYTQTEYYHRARDRGTLICHYRHRAHDNALLWPGLQDISASVDFSAVAAAAVAAGLAVTGFTNQTFFLLGCGLEALMAELDPADQTRYLAQTGAVKRLILPGEMGERFKAIALARDCSIPLLGFALADQRHRL